MHKFKGINVSAKEIIDISKNMISDERRLVIINGYINEDKEPVVCYNFDIDGEIETYKIIGEKEIPTITSVYKESARWCEEEIEEMMDIKFLGLNRSGRLFLPDEFKNGEGQILVMPLDELKKCKDK